MGSASSSSFWQITFSGLWDVRRGDICSRCDSNWAGTNRDWSRQPEDTARLLHLRPREGQVSDKNQHECHFAVGCTFFSFRDFVDFNKENKPINLASPPQTFSPVPTFEQAPKQVRVGFPPKKLKRGGFYQWGVINCQKMTKSLSINEQTEKERTEKISTSGWVLSWRAGRDFPQYSDLASLL